ncbi:BTAD domain-containing putative transcriptional regulator [Streptosporangium lutulentum]
MCRALALWRGTPLADLPNSPLWDSRLRSLTEVRLAAAEELIDLRMDRGRYADAIGELRGLLGEHPFREDLSQRLMLALHRSGRQAEALRTYTAIRQRLVTELGIEPGAELRRAHAVILAGEPLRPRPFPPLTSSPGRFGLHRPGRRRRRAQAGALAPGAIAGRAAFGHRGGGAAGGGQVGAGRALRARRPSRLPRRAALPEPRGTAHEPPIPASCWPRRCGRWASERTACRTPCTNGPRCTGPCWPDARCSYSSTTPPEPRRCARCCRAAVARCS